MVSIQCPICARRVSFDLPAQDGSWKCPHCLQRFVQQPGSTGTTSSTGRVGARERNAGHCALNGTGQAFRILWR